MSDWIPLKVDISEPSKLDTVLVSANGRVRVARYMGNRWFLSVPGSWAVNFVTAWQPLPDAYVPEGKAPHE